MNSALTNNQKRLIRIGSTWLKNPDPGTWGPTNNPEWSEGSGRTLTGKAQGSRKYWKYKIPLVWSHISEEDLLVIQQLIEDGSDYFTVTFYHRCRYITIQCYAGLLTATGINNAGGNITYDKATVNLIER